MVKNPPANAVDPWVRKNALEECMATPSSTLAWRIPWTDCCRPGRLQSMGSQSPTQLKRLSMRAVLRVLEEQSSVTSALPGSQGSSLKQVMAVAVKPPAPPP